MNGNKIDTLNSLLKSVSNGENNSQITFITKGGVVEGKVFPSLCKNNTLILIEVKIYDGNRIFELGNICLFYEDIVGFTVLD